MHPTLRKIIPAAVIAVILCSLTACDVEDSRDLCCERIVMEYRYRLNWEDAFSDNITSLRHFLFGGDEKFIREVPQSKCMRQQYLDHLNTGTYTMVTVGNSTDITNLEAPAPGESLADFMLSVEDEEGADTDPLFYGICPFTLTREDITRQRHFVTYLSNVHCRMEVTVKWQYMPPVLKSDKIYRITLDDCATDYRLNGTEGYSLNEKRFPHLRRRPHRHKHQGAGRHRRLGGRRQFRLIR